MATATFDYLHLVDLPPTGARSAAGFVAGLLSRLNLPLWGQCEFPYHPSGTVIRGVIAPVPVTADAETIARGAARIRWARRRGIACVSLGGGLGGREALAGALAAAAGLPVHSGLALERAAAVESSAHLLRWRGVDPERARALVLISPEDPRLGEAVAESLVERVGIVAVRGLDRQRLLALRDRVRARTGGVLELPGAPRTAPACLDLVVITGRVGGTSRQLDEAEEAVEESGAASSGAVVLDLSERRSGSGRRGGEVREKWVRLAGPVAPTGPGVPTDIGRRPSYLSATWGAIRVCRFAFLAPPGWRGRPEPGLEPGYVSAGMVSGTVAVSRRRGVTAALSRRRAQAAGSRRALREATALGFTLALVGVIGPDLPARDRFLDSGGGRPL